MHKEYDILSLLMGCLFGLIGGIGKFMISLTGNQFSFLKFGIDIGVGLIIGLLAGAIALNYNMSAYMLLIISLIAGMTGKEFLDIVLVSVRKKIGVEIKLNNTSDSD
jgi:hypothetical protein